MQTSVQAIPGCTGIAYDKLTISYFAWQGDIHGAVLRFANPSENIVSRKIRIKRFRPGNPFPRVLEAQGDGVKINSHHSLLAAARVSLDRLGYRQIEGEISIRWIRTGEHQEDWTVDLMLRVVGAGDVGLSLQSGKVNAEGIAAAMGNPLNWLMVLPPIELVEGKLVYQDRGLADRILELAAREQGRPPEDIRKTLLYNLQTKSQTEPDPKVRAVWQSLAAFWRRPGQITLQTRLERPLPLGQLLWMRQPQEIIRGLAIESTVD